MGEWDDLLYEAEWRLLRALAANDGGITPGSLAKQVGLSWQALTPKVNALKRMGLVRVESWPKLTLYSLSPQGRLAVDGHGGPGE